MSDKKITAYAVRDFNDAGTEEAFAAGKNEFSAGAYANYKAAGLVSDKPADVQKPAADGAPAAA